MGGWVATLSATENSLMSVEGANYLKRDCLKQLRHKGIQ